ncbi:MAG: 4-alpha-glucanotransferase, partial [Prolixibacteraceae bacterium]|nr:4-alpha-glucanotransferase [Prolixibacteraceae bacterium]
KNEERKNIRRYFTGRKKKVSLWAVEKVWASVADVAVVPLQDILGLGSKARMNIPGTASGNWGWRLKTKQFTNNHIHLLKKLNKKYNR